MKISIECQGEVAPGVYRYAVLGGQLCSYVGEGPRFPPTRWDMFNSFEEARTFVWNLLKERKRCQ